MLHATVASGIALATVLICGRNLFGQNSGQRMSRDMTYLSYMYLRDHAASPQVTYCFATDS